MLVEYGTGHSDWRNKVIHLIFVPALMWSALVWCSYLPVPRLPLPSPWSGVLDPHVGLLVVLMYSAFFVWFDLVPGLTCSLLMAALYLLANLFVLRIGPAAWIYATAVHTLSWWLQIHVGHYMCEGGPPTLTERPLQSFLMSPLFSWYEVLFLCGYRRDFHRQLTSAVEKRKMELRGGGVLGGRGKDA